MIQFNILKFINSCQFQIDAQIPELSYYSDCYIDSVLVDTEDTVCELGPSTKAVTLKTFGDHPKHIQELFDVSQLCGGKPKLLFVYVKMRGVPDPATTPCSMDKEYDMMPCADLSYVYQYALKSIKCTAGCGCIGQDCAVDAVFANFALQYLRFTNALVAKDWVAVYESYRALMRKSGSKARKVPEYKPCRCNG